MKMDILIGILHVISALAIGSLSGLFAALADHFRTFGRPILAGVCMLTAVVLCFTSFVITFML